MCGKWLPLLCPKLFCISILNSMNNASKVKVGRRAQVGVEAGLPPPECGQQTWACIQPFRLGPLWLGKGPALANLVVIKIYIVCFRRCCLWSCDFSFFLDVKNHQSRQPFWTRSGCRYTGGENVVCVLLALPCSSELKSPECGQGTVISVLLDGAGEDSLRLQFFLSPQSAALQFRWQVGGQVGTFCGWALGAKCYVRLHFLSIILVWRRQVIHSALGLG